MRRVGEAAQRFIDVMLRWPQGERQIHSLQKVARDPHQTSEDPLGDPLCVDIPSRHHIREVHVRPRRCRYETNSAREDLS